MSVETFANDSETTLASAVTDGSVTSISVTAHASFPQSGQFRIRIENELLLVTAGAGTNSWTVTRGVEGTSGAAHSNGSKVIHVVTAGALAKFRADSIISDAIVNRPSAGVEGRLFIPENGLIVQRDTSSVWQSYGPLFRFTQPPAAANFTAVNAGSSSLNDSGGSLLLSTPYATGTSRRIYKRSAPATPYSLTVAFRYVACRSGSGRTRVGLLFRQSSDGKLYASNLVLSGTTIPQFEIRTSSSPTDSGSDIIGAIPFDHCGPIVWMRIRDDGTNRLTYLSSDGVNFAQAHSIGRTSYLTADEIGVFVDYDWASSPKIDLQCQILSWDES